MPATGPQAGQQSQLLATPLFWAAFSFLAGIALGAWLFERPRKWWLIIAAAVAAFILFGLEGFSGLVAVLAVKLWRSSRENKKPEKNSASAIKAKGKAARKKP